MYTSSSCRQRYTSMNQFNCVMGVSGADKLSKFRNQGCWGCSSVIPVIIPEHPHTDYTQLIKKQKKWPATSVPFSAVFRLKEHVQTFSHPDKILVIWLLGQNLRNAIVSFWTSVLTTLVANTGFSKGDKRRRNFMYLRRMVAIEIEAHWVLAVISFSTSSKDPTTINHERWCWKEKLLSWISVLDNEVAKDFRHIDRNLSKKPMYLAFSSLSNM